MNILTVTQLNNLIKRTLDREYLLKNLYVSGTVVNAKRHSSGHIYFSLKDDEASVDVTIWSSTVISKGLTNAVQNGLLVTVKASVNFYNKMGRLSLVASDIQVGEKSPLQVEFDALKKELTALGYFDTGHKRMIPEMSACIGIVTSQSGAVLHDILHISAQRNPLVRFKLFSVPVQGKGAGPVIAEGIRAADTDPDVDVIIVGRGGGSMEDLWCFNDRIVVETVYHARTPIISAVGHETDYTLCDYAADMRAATPSHAAEMSVIPLTFLKEQLEAKHDYIQHVTEQIIKRKRDELSVLFNRRLGIPALQFLHRQKSQLSELSQTAKEKTVGALQNKRHSLLLLSQQLEMLNPLHILNKGYTIPEKDGHSVRSVSAVAVNDTLTVMFKDGRLTATVKEIQHNGGITEKL